jgi:hypothetical protein
MDYNHGMKKTLAALILVLAAAAPALAQVTSLAHVFLPGKTLKDTDGDGLADRVVLCVVIPDSATAAELAAAADISSRANFDSLSQDLMGLVRREADAGRIDRLENPILLGTNVKWLKDALRGGDIEAPPLGANEGWVSVFPLRDGTGLAVAAGSDEALLQTARAFFLRWPYLWDIWGREEGQTYATLEKDLEQFLAGEGLRLQRTVIRSVLYELPPAPKGPGAIRKLAFSAGEIKNLTVEINFTDEEDLAAARKAFDGLKLAHLRGQRSELLSYAGCARITLDLRFGKTRAEAVLPRQGFPKRMLTAAYKDTTRADGAGRDFDLTGLFTTRGFYGDADKDGVLDMFDSQIVVPSAGAPRAVTALASRLVLPTAGATFPIVALDREIEPRKPLTAPILVGATAQTQELIRVGKLVPPALENAAGLLTVVPRAFNKSSALAVLGADTIGLEKTLAYLARSFPYFESFGPGRPQIGDVPAELEAFLKGEHGSAESFFLPALRRVLDDIKDRDVESLKVELLLPKANPKFEEEIRRACAATFKSPAAEISAASATDGRKILEKEKTFPWEGTEALNLVKAKLKDLPPSPEPIKISLGLSESPEIRTRLRKQIEQAAAELVKVPVEVEVASSYKQGFFWLTEKILPALKGKGVAQVIVRFAEEKTDLRKPRRFYAEPTRWLQELYPADEILSRELALPLEKIRFEMSPALPSGYEVSALDARNAPLLEQAFSPRVREIPYLKVLPEWGTVKLTTGWARFERGAEIFHDAPLASDLENFWSFYQDEILPAVNAQVLKKTGGTPTFSKQPFFKQLRLELWASEPDYRLGLDEEIVSSLEALHDEIYFDTLDFLRGLTDIDVEEGEQPEDTQRFSAPGNVLPVIHASVEGEAPRVKVTFEEWAGPAPQMTIRWKENGAEESVRRIAFPTLKSKPVRIPTLVYNGLEEKLDSLTGELEFDKETEYLAFLDLLPAYRELLGREALASPLSYPALDSLRLRVRCRDLVKEELLPVPAPPETRAASAPAAPRPGETLVDTTRILSPEDVAALAARLGRFPILRTYGGGRSYEGRDVPVIEAYKPSGDYVSIPRLIALKPTIHLIGRQHANEVSSTTYILRLAELLATDKAWQDYVGRINFVLQPLENPDGAALAFDLQKLTPFHSLHAGRYGSLGIDVGSLGGSGRPILPEALVRRDLQARWAPDIALNLHGYPSHEWVQQFSGYTPFLFRDYWIPKGWFTYFRSLNLSIYARYKEAGEELRGFITTEMNADPRLKESNKRFYDRYARWSARWQPYVGPLELYDGVNIYARRRGGSENRLTLRAQTTYAEETPELMDETARGLWLDFLSTQGLSYLRAHLKYLSQAKFETARIEEEAGERVRIQIVRARPGTTRK